MITGTVKFFNVAKWFGFITDENGKDVFVHQTGLKEGVRLVEGEKVQFETEMSEKWPNAINVEKI